MANLIEKLAGLATQLDNAKLTKAADIVDSINNNVLRIVTAQYEGVQGYWVRNQRCWSNCYRQKRQSSDKPAQVIWSECQSEYEESLGKDNSAWDKYAEGLPNLIKIASGKQKGNIAAEQDRFHKSVFAKVAEGSDYANAVWDTITDEQKKHIAAIEHQVARLANVAKYLKKTGNDKLAKEAGDLTNEILKLAQFNASWMNPLQKFKEWRAQNGFLGGQGKIDVPQLTQRLQRAMQAVQNLRTRFPQDMTKLPPQMQNQINQQMAALQQQVGGELSAIEQMTQNNPQAGQIYQQLIVPFHQFSATPLQNLKSRRIALDQVANALQKATGLVNSLGNTQESAMPQNSNIKVPTPKPAPAAPATAPKPDPAASAAAPTNTPQRPDWIPEDAWKDIVSKHYKGATPPAAPATTPSNDVADQPIPMEGDISSTIKKFITDPSNLQMLATRLERELPGFGKKKAASFSLHKYLVKTAGKVIAQAATSDTAINSKTITIKDMVEYIKRVYQSANAERNPIVQALTKAGYAYTAPSAAAPKASPSPAAPAAAAPSTPTVSPKVEPAKVEPPPAAAPAVEPKADTPAAPPVAAKPPETNVAAEPSVNAPTEDIRKNPVYQKAVDFVNAEKKRSPQRVFSPVTFQRQFPELSLSQAKILSEALKADGLYKRTPAPAGAAQPEPSAVSTAAPSVPAAPTPAAAGPAKAPEVVSPTNPPEAAVSPATKDPEAKAPEVPVAKVPEAAPAKAPTETGKGSVDPNEDINLDDLLDVKAQPEASTVSPAPSAPAEAVAATPAAPAAEAAPVAATPATPAAEAAEAAPAAAQAPVTTPEATPASPVATTPLPEAATAANSTEPVAAPAAEDAPALKTYEESQLNNANKTLNAENEDASAFWSSTGMGQAAFKANKVREKLTYGDALDEDDIDDLKEFVSDKDVAKKPNGPAAQAVIGQVLRDLGESTSSPTAPAPVNPAAKAPKEPQPPVATAIPTPKAPTTYEKPQVDESVDEDGNKVYSPEVLSKATDILNDMDPKAIGFLSNPGAADFVRNASDAQQKLLDGEKLNETDIANLKYFVSNPTVGKDRNGQIAQSEINKLLEALGEKTSAPPAAPTAKAPESPALAPVAKAPEAPAAAAPAAPVSTPSPSVPPAAANTTATPANNAGSANVATENNKKKIDQFDRAIEIDPGLRAFMRSSEGMAVKNLVDAVKNGKQVDPGFIRVLNHDFKNRFKGNGWRKRPTDVSLFNYIKPLVDQMSQKAASATQRRVVLASAEYDAQRMLRKLKKGF